MPSKKPKHAYHHGDLRRALLDAALSIVERGGAGALSLRELARKAGVSHAAPYRHFASREALLAALAVEGFRGLEAEMRARADRQTDPLRRLRALGLAYVRYAVAHPGHFRVMFSSDLLESAKTPELEEAAAATLRALIECVADAQAAGELRPGDPRRLALPAWTNVHGLSMLLVDRQLGALFEGEIDVEAQAKEVIDMLMRGLGRGQSETR